MEQTELNAKGAEQTETAAEQKPFVRRGSFRVGYSSEDKAVLMCIVGAVLCACMFVVGLVLSGAPEDFLSFMGSVFWIIPAVLCLLLIPVILYGRNCTYYAGTEEFEAITPRGSDYLYYKEVTEVIYKPIMLWGRQRGWLVTVVTNVRDFTFRLLFDRGSELTEPKHTPFYLLELNAGLKQPEAADPELSAAIMSQFAVMQEKQEDRLSKKRKKKTWENLFDD